MGVDASGARSQDLDVPIFTMPGQHFMWACDQNADFHLYQTRGMGTDNATLRIFVDPAALIISGEVKLNQTELVP